VLTNKTKLAFDFFREFLVGLPRQTKSLVVIAADFAGFSVSVFLAAWTVAGTVAPPAVPAYFVGLTSIVSILMAWWQGLYHAVVRYIGVDLIVAGALTAMGSALLAAGAVFVVGIEISPARWAIAFSAYAGIYICGSRYFARVFLIQRSSRRLAQSVIIYGAGSAGAQLAISLQGAGDHVPVAMVDDDRTLHGKKIQGLTVFPPAAIESLISQKNVDGVLLALPSASRRKRRRVLERLSEFPVHVQTMPEFKDIISGRARVDDIRDVDVQDLLGRNPVPPNPALLDACIKGKNVMVTGAGGSIGSELCRQILRLEPANLVLFEISEVALYEVDQQVRTLAEQLGSKSEITALLGSVHHERRIQDVMETFSIQTVYHAAAYKHVPIVEQNLFEGIHNNIFGALHAVRAAIDAGVESFVLISTDKAVNPTNVMGATKRFSELILQAYQAQRTGTRLCMVRFGNVLESSGSVVPLFRKQIRGGGPVTVTHRDIIRYFMTIPEASQLVIQAGSMARGGDVFVLDMGKPVKIHDLACRMIKLMGLTVRDDGNPDGDIEIQYIGLRPAEKLFEELLIGADVSGTEHPRILRADEDFLPIDALLVLLHELMDASLALDHDKARNILLRAVKEYSPANGIDDLVWASKHGGRAAKEHDTVVEFPTKQA
jgi:FlaA1/EpsC-like NDP-sugar epimerase